MTAPSRRADYLDHMAEAVGRALGYVAGMDHASFAADQRTQQEVLMNLVVLGEAATQLAARYPEFVAAEPGLPWAHIRGMRNRLAHAYFDIDLDVVWQTLQDKLPALKLQLAALLNSERKVV